MSSNNIGIGIDNPQEKLHVNGGVLLGSSNSNNNGTIRWTGTDFQGRKNGSWISFTSLGLKGDTGNRGVSGSNGSIGADGANGAPGAKGTQGEGLDGFVTLAAAADDKPNGSIRFKDDIFQCKVGGEWYVMPLAEKVDTTAPTGYSVSAFTLDGDNATFTMAGAEIGSALAYTITDGSASVSGTVANVASATESVSSVNISSLSDGTLTVSVTLSDTAGNAGTAATKTVVKA